MVVKHLALVLATASLSIGSVVWAQESATHLGPSGLGRPATKGEVQAWDIAISSDGKELPPGSGTAVLGASVFTQRACSTCHGPTGKEGPAPVLIPPPPAPMAGMGSNAAASGAGGGGMGMGGGGGAGGGGGTDPTRPLSHTNSRVTIKDWPFAPTIWDFVHRAMPYQTPGRLSADDTYSVVAYLLFKNGIIQEDDVMDAKSLPKVQMPRRAEYKLPPKWKPGDPMKFTYRIDPSVKPASGTTSK